LLKLSTLRISLVATLLTNLANSEAIIKGLELSQHLNNRFTYCFY